MTFEFCKRTFVVKWVLLLGQVSGSVQLSVKRCSIAWCDICYYIFNYICEHSITKQFLYSYLRYPGIF